jgi:uncharacterized protein (TIGR00369 family)
VTPFRDEWGTPRHKTVTWYDPAIVGAAAADMSGSELLQAIADGRLPDPPMASLVGARLAFAGDGEVRFRCTPDESACNPRGTIHGGLLCTLLDFAAGGAVHTLLPARVQLASIEIKVTYLMSPRVATGDIEVHGEALRIGRQVAFAEAHARNSEGELVGHATSSIAVHWPGGYAPPGAYVTDTRGRSS